MTLNLRTSLRRAYPLVAAAALVLAAWPLAGGFARRTPPGPGPDADPGEAARSNSIGVAYMGQQRFADAQKQFEEALRAQPDYALAKLNLGISYLSQQRTEEARKALEEASAKLPRDPYGWYNLGLVYKDLGDQEKAIRAFERVTEIAPDEPDAFYFIGYLNTQLQRYEPAVAAFQSALRIFPYHASAEFGLARAYQRKGDGEAARQHLERFQKMTAAKLGTPFGAGYGDQGKFSLAEYAKNGLPKAPAAIPVRFAAEPLAGGPASGACFFDFDGDGKPDLLLASAADGGSLRLYRNAGGKLEDRTAGSGLDLKGQGLGCAAGDYDNDGRTDLAVCLADGVHLFHNEGGRFAESTRAAGIRAEKGCAGPTFVDYDHDGDLDLYVTGGAHNVLWRNNGNGTFTDVTSETAPGGEGTGAGVVTSDFNNDRAVDFVLAGGAKGASVWLNPREGKFEALAGIDFGKAGLPPAVGVASFDFDKDGWMDLAFTHGGPPGLSLWRNREGKELERVPLPDLGWKEGAGVAALDYDNDGWIDLAAVGEGPAGGELRLLRNLGGGAFRDATADAKLAAVKLTKPVAVASAGVSGTGGMDLVVTQAGGAPLLLRNQGAERNGWMDIDLKALNDNKSAIGTKVELFAGALYQ